MNLRSLIVGMVVATASTAAFAGGADGVWKTEADDQGAYLEVTIAPCESDSSKTCGKISNALTKQGADPKYANLGKLMVKDMESADGENYSGARSGTRSTTRPSSRRCTSGAMTWT